MAAPAHIVATPRQRPAAAPWHGRLIGAASSQRNYWDGNQLVEKASYNSSTNTETHQKTFVFGPRIDELLLYVDVSPNPDLEYYAHADHLGSVMALVDDTGAIQESYRYTEWGVPTILDDSFTRQSAGSSSPVGNPVMYTGQKYAPVASGSGEIWYDYRARHYRADAGRFVQRDPAGYGDGGNRYHYVGGGPIGATDPSGRIGKWVAGPSRQGGIDDLPPLFPYPVFDPCDFVDPEGDWGGIVCFEGKKYVCVFSTGNATDPDAMKAVSKCIKEHELQHLSETNIKCPEDSSTPTFSLPLPQDELAASECSAYTAEKECLKDEKLKCPGTSGTGPCVDQINDVLDAIDEEIDFWCGGG